MKNNKIIIYAFTIGISLIAGIIGMLFNSLSLKTWYLFLNKPFFNPPNWIFAPVWLILFILMGISLGLILDNKKIKIKEKADAVFIFTIQLVFNIAWSMFFFALRNPMLGFMDIILLWLAIIANMLYFQKLNKISARLLFPYFLWVSFASILNYSIWMLNY